MKTTLKSFATILFTIVTAMQAHSQGYIVSGGVSQLGFNGFGYEFHVIQNPTNLNYTGFFLAPSGKTPPTSLYTNTYSFAVFLDEGVRVFLVGSNNPISLQAIQSQNYTELGYAPNYVFNSGSPFYLGFYTGETFPQNGVYSDPLFGWARLVNNQGVIQMLDSVLAYKAQGILVGTQTIIPEPSVLSLFGLGGLLFGFRRSQALIRQKENVAKKILQKPDLFPVSRH